MTVVVLTVKVTSNARASLLEAGEDGGPWRARLAAPPVDGKANAELIGLVARHFGVAKARVTIDAGAAGRLKRLRVETA